MDARIHMIQQTLHQRPARQIERRQHSQEAAVAVILRPREELELLLIKRAQHERDPWSGHIALPGGRRSPDDPDLKATAYRETAEEVAVQLSAIGLFLGALGEVAPVTPRLPHLIIAPFVVAVPEFTSATANAAEVEFNVWVPVSSLRDPAAAGEILIQFEGGNRPYPSLQYGEHVIWGLTLRILKEFLEVTESLGV